ncbi:cuticlin-1-like [Calliopsis andreniformis]|uniref:cuticlin-1-like n=1 Tax=Calliopsis andreniformis TaxID=337506 RepID=UPI003FCD6BC9
MRLPLPLLLFLVFTLKQYLAEEIWEQDLSMDMEIGASTEGYDQVALRCGAEKMTVDLKTSEEFSGVIYTQGSFYSKQSPCFLDAARGGTFIMSIPFDQCETENEGNKYKNILIIQHDDELVTPGDAAFILECDFSQPRDLTVSAELNELDKREVRSSISLIDADPGRDKTKRMAYVESDNEEVIFVPSSISKINDEL